MKPDASLAMFDEAVVDAVKTGATRFYQIDARLSRGREYHWRLLDRRLQSLRKAGRLTFDAKAGWTVAPSKGQELTMSEATISTSLLRGVPREKYAEIWCKLNDGDEWHELVPDRPANFDTMTRSAKHSFIWPIMEEIMGEIGIKECLREWNKENMPGEEFDRWWDGRGGRL